VKYSIDPRTNRLRIIRRNKILSPVGFFKINADNYLEYWLNGPSAWLLQNNLPGKITFIGTWKLTTQDDLQLSVRKASYMPESLSGLSRLTINGKILAGGDSKLVFEVQSRDNKGLQHARLLKLSGTWGSDNANRIVFSVSKREAPDILTLSGSWSVNDNQQITYTLKKYNLVTKEKVLAECDFSGYWRLSARNRLAYVFSKGSHSRFDFKAHIETPNLYPSAGLIKYRFGTGLRQAQLGSPPVVCLYGQWKVSRYAGLSFEMEYEKGKFRSLEFGARVDVSKRDRIEFTLRDYKNNDLGGTLIFTRRFLKALDAHVFARVKKLANEKAIDAGITIPF